MTTVDGSLSRSLASVSRRAVVAGIAATALSFTYRKARSREAVTFGLTPVFLDSDVRLLADLKSYLSEHLGRAVNLVKRRTYQDITLMLLSDQLDAAWICGFPYVQYSSSLSVMTVPVYNGKPLYQSYVIVNQNLEGKSIDELRGQVHAFSDPDSNSGYLVTRAMLADMGERPETFFERHFFTYGHRNVIRAVASGLAQSGSVDGYVWDVMRETESHFTEGARVIRKSEWLGFPPIACSQKARDSEVTQALTRALVDMPNHALGRQVLTALHLDGFGPPESDLFGGIAALYEKVRRQA